MAGLSTSERDNKNKMEKGKGVIKIIKYKKSHKCVLNNFFALNLVILLNIIKIDIKS